MQVDANLLECGVECALSLLEVVPDVVGCCAHVSGEFGVQCYRDECTNIEALLVWGGIGVPCQDGGLEGEIPSGMKLLELVGVVRTVSYVGEGIVCMWGMAMVAWL